MTAHPQGNTDAYEGADMDAEMDAGKRGEHDRCWKGRKQEGDRKEDAG